MALKLVYQIDFLLVLKGEGLSDFDPAQALDFFEIKALIGANVEIVVI